MCLAIAPAENFAFSTEIRALDAGDNEIIVSVQVTNGNCPIVCYFLNYLSSSLSLHFLSNHTDLITDCTHSITDPTHSFSSSLLQYAFFRRRSLS